MSGRLKFLLAVLAAGAGLTFWYAVRASITDTSRDMTAMVADSFGVATACGDADEDGLCDYDETNWGTDFKNPDSDGDGFLDGEEVVSGHNPKKAGPDDYMNNKRNLTQQVSALLINGVIGGTLQKDNPDYQAAVDSLVDSIFTQYDSNVAIELDSISLASDSEDALISYGLRMTDLLGPMLKEISENFKGLTETVRGVPLTDVPAMKDKYPEQFKAFVAAADAEAIAFGPRVDAVKSLRAPPQVREFHRSLLLYLRGMQQRYVSLKTIDRDPLSGLISLQVIRTLAVRTPTLLVASLQNTMADALNSK